MEWKVTESDRKRLNLLSKAASSKDRIVLEKAAQKESLTFEDLTNIKNSLPADAPVFAFFNKLTVNYDAVEYKASPEFRAKTEKLRQQQENEQYKRIVQSVDATQRYGKVNHMENFGSEMRTVNRQLMSVINVVITVVGSFFFGFSGVTYAYPNLKLDLAERFLIGLILGTIVFFADLYFVVKSMDEEPLDKDKTKKPFENSYNLNFSEVKKDEKTVPTTKPKSAKAKKND